MEKSYKLPLICMFGCGLLYALTAILTDLATVIWRISNADSVTHLMMIALFVAPILLYLLERSYEKSKKGSGALLFWLGVAGCAAGIFVFIVWCVYVREEILFPNNPAEAHLAATSRFFTFVVLALGFLWTMAFRGIMAFVNWLKMGY